MSSAPTDARSLRPMPSRADFFGWLRPSLCSSSWRLSWLSPLLTQVHQRVRANGNRSRSAPASVKLIRGTQGTSFFASAVRGFKTKVEDTVQVHKPPQLSPVVGSVQTRQSNPGASAPPNPCCRGGGERHSSVKAVSTSSSPHENAHQRCFVRSRTAGEKPAGR